MLAFTPPRPLQPPELAALPNDAACAMYAQRGWHLTGVILPTALLDAVRADLERYLRGERDAALVPAATQLDWKPDNPEPIRIHGYLALQMQAFQRLVSTPVLAATAARLAHATAIRLFHDRLIIKPAGLPREATETGWHTDTAYWGSASSAKLLTAWIPLGDYDEGTGTLMVVDGSHRWPAPSVARRFLERDLDGRLPASMVPDGETALVRALPVRMGQVIFHHCRLLHRSSPNGGAAPRVALAVHLQDDGNAYRPWQQANGRFAAHHVDR